MRDSGDQSQETHENCDYNRSTSIINGNVAVVHGKRGLLSKPEHTDYRGNAVHAQLYLIAVYAMFSESMVTMAFCSLVNLLSR